MLLKALKFMTLIHRQIECSQWDHQHFPGKKYFSKKIQLRQKSWETKKMERKKLPVKSWNENMSNSEETKKSLFWWWSSFVQLKVDKCWSVITHPIRLWSDHTALICDHTSDFHLITHPSLPQKRTPHSERTILWSCQFILYSRSSSKSTEEEIGF